MVVKTESLSILISVLGFQGFRGLVMVMRYEYQPNKISIRSEIEKEQRIHKPPRGGTGQSNLCNKGDVELDGKFICIDFGIGISNFT